MHKTYKQAILEEHVKNATAKLIQDLLARKKTVVTATLDDQFDRLGGDDVLDIGTYFN